MSNKKLSIGIVGCGNIAEKYVENVARYKILDIRAVADQDHNRAVDFGDRYGLPVCDDCEQLFEDSDIQMIVNLTPPSAHYDIIKRGLSVGKHVFTEKPFTLELNHARELVGLAEKKSLRLFSAPITFLGPPQKTITRLVKEGLLGKVRYFSVELHNGRIESWHPAPEAFFNVGPLWDVGLYPLVHLFQMFGPVVRLNAIGQYVIPERIRLDGTPFTITAPDMVTAMLEFEGGIKGGLRLSFVIPEAESRRQGLEIYGDEGTLHLGKLFMFDSKITYTPAGGESRNIQPDEAEVPGVNWALGLFHVADHLLNGAPIQIDISVALHGIAVLQAIEKSMSGQDTQNGACWITL